MDELERAVDIWRQVFEDDDKYIRSFYQTFPHSVLMHESGQAMLNLLPVKIGDERGSCIYAAATLREARGYGYMGELIESAKERCRDRGEHFIVLYPAEDSLYHYYERFGFEACKGGGQRAIFRDDTEGEGRRCSALRYRGLRSRCIEGLYVDWASRALRFMADDGVFYMSTSGDACAYYSEGKIEELVGNPKKLPSLAQYILKDQNRVSAAAVLQGRDRYGMICPLDDLGFYEYRHCFVSLNME